MTDSTDSSLKKQNKKSPRNRVLIVVTALAVLALVIFLRRSFFSDANTDSPAGTEHAKSDSSGHESNATSGAAGSLPSISGAKNKSRQAAHQSGLDPAADGWTSEVDAEHAKKHLSALLDLATKNVKIDVAALRAVSSDFHCNALRPADLVEVLGDESIRVLEQGEQGEQNSETVHKGASGLAQALSDFAAPLRNRDELHTHVKVIRVTADADKVTTTSIIETGGHSAKNSIGQHANWTCQWQRNGDSLSLRSIRSDHYREVTGSGPNGVWFADCTQAILGKNPSFGNQLVFGLNHWLERIERVQGSQVFARWGVAIGDVNGDGLDDLYVCQPGGLPNRLLIQQPDGTATDQSSAAGVDWLDHTSSALLIDLDNDGDQDLVAATSHGILLMSNDSTGQFKWRATLPTPDTDVQSLSAADYDNDGDLDLYICIDFANYAVLRNEAPVEFVYYNANDGGANVLFRNDITSQDECWKLTDVTAETGLNVNNRRHSLAASWEDYDNDGDQDLYVANDYGQNCLYRNDGGRFVDIATKSGVIDQGSGMSVSWGDFNRDGRMDLYVANMFSSAGNRITRQSKFRSDADQSVRSAYSRFAKGNSLFTGDESGTFREDGAAAGVEMGRWAWSSLFADLNNDGWQDLLVANGYITTEDTGDL
ncbi:MAG: hypothetical protein ACJAR1_000198 [Rubritalea sp.]|jgi:hypothetical protein